MMTLKFSQNTKVICALTSRRLVHPKTNDDFEIQLKVRPADDDDYEVVNILQVYIYIYIYIYNFCKTLKQNNQKVFFKLQGQYPEEQVLLIKQKTMVLGSMCLAKVCFQNFARIFSAYFLKLE